MPYPYHLLLTPAELQCICHFEHSTFAIQTRLEFAEYMPCSVSGVLLYV